MAKSNGIKSLKQAAKLLNKHSPDGESLAYINPEEARLLRASGGSGIQTLQGVPSYSHGPWWNPFKWHLADYEKDGVLTKGLISKGKTLLGYDDRVITKGDKEYTVPGRSIVGDVISTWAYFRAKKDKEGLNEAEEAEFNRLNQQLASAKTEFNVGTAEGTELKPEYETDITKSAAYRPITFDAAGATTPDLTTTAVAQGGRIGAFNGGIQGLMPQQAMPQQAMPQQAMPQQAMPQQAMPQPGFMPQPGLMPQRLGFQDTGSVVDTESAEYKAWKNLYTSGNTDMAKEYHPNHETYKKYLEAQGKAQGGRIGYNLGGIDRPFQGIGALNRMGYALGEEVEQVTEEVTPFAKVPPHIKMADIDDLPDWWLTDFEELIQDFRGDHNGQGPQNLNDLEKWHRFKYGKAQGPNIEEMLNTGVTDENTNPQEVEQLLGSMQAAQGGRIGAQGGGIMPLLDMGGMEKDYRQDGGFVPIGRKEKADDVPARLSKNEFVFTADAVKAAGGGDIDEGAQRMYNVMKNLEAGGEISQQSQGQG